MQGAAGRAGGEEGRGWRQAAHRADGAERSCKPGGKKERERLFLVSDQEHVGKEKTDPCVW